MRGSTSFLMRSLPYRMITGPLCRSATKCSRTGALATRNSSVTTKRSRKLRSCPPYFLGQVMPIQPLAPDLAAELLAEGVIVPGSVRIEGAGVDLLGEEGAHLLPRSLALGWQADRVECQLGCHVPLSSPRRQHRPQPVAPLRRDQVAQLDRPEALVAEVVAPRPQPSREAVQRVLRVKPMAPSTWWAMPAPSPAASPTRILAEAASRNTPSSNAGGWRWHRRQTRPRPWRRPPRRPAAPGCAARPGTWRSGARRPRVRWHRRRRCRGPPPARRSSAWRAPQPPWRAGSPRQTRRAHLGLRSDAPPPSSPC